MSVPRQQKTGRLIWVVFLGVFLATGAATVWGDTPHYVAHGGQTPMSNYTSWATAASNIQDAVDAAIANDTVLVSNGNYTLTNQINILREITVRGFNGQDQTFVNGNYPWTTNRCFYIYNAPAVLDGLTISNGYAGNGGGVLIYHLNPTFTGGSILTNCTITDNTATNFGGGLYATRSGTGSTTNVISHCVISKNLAQCKGGGIYAHFSRFEDCLIDGNCTGSNGVSNAGHPNGGAGAWIGSGVLMLNCTIVSNTGTEFAKCGGGVYMEYFAILRNCLIRGNCSARESAVYLQGWDTIENSTIVQNVGTGNYAAVSFLGNQPYVSTIRNSIIMFNTSAGTASNWAFNGSKQTGLFYNCCTAPLPTGAHAGDSTNNIAFNPLFVATNDADYRLSRGSPCIDAGTNQDWMSAGTDFGGLHRLNRWRGVVDIGAYEFVPKGTLFSGH